MWANYLMKLVNRIKAILLTPQAEWKVIERERDTLSDLLISYVAILAAIPEIAHFIGQSPKRQSAALRGDRHRLRAHPRDRADDDLATDAAAARRRTRRAAAVTWPFTWPFRFS
jgi:hypothetical protein